MEKQTIRIKGGLDLKGKIKSEIKSKDSTLIEVCNTISKYAKNVVIGDSIGRYFTNASSNPIGKICSVNDVIAYNQYSLFGSTGNEISSADGYLGDTKGLTIYLLNLSNSSLVVDEKTKFIQLYNLDGQLKDYVVGYTTLNDASPSNVEALEVTIDPTKIIMNNNVSKAYKWADGTPSFIYDTIVVAPNKPFGMFKAYKCVSDVFEKAVGNELRSGIITPGATGLTGANEIAMNFKVGSVERWLFNVETGVYTQVESLKPLGAFTFTDNYCSMSLIVNNRLFIVKTTHVGTTVYNYDENEALYLTPSVDVYDLNESGATFVKNIPGPTSGRVKCIGLFFNGTDVIFNTCSSKTYGTESQTYHKVFKIKPDTLVTTSTNNIAYAEWKLPETWEKNKTCIKWFDGTNYYIYNAKWDKVFICTDLMKIEETLIGMTDNFDSAFKIGDKIYYFLTGTRNYMREVITNISNVNIKLSYIKTGVWINRDEYSNWFSFYKFDTPRDKTPNKSVTINYSYEIQ